MEFSTAEKLRKVFEVEASFYQTRIGGDMFQFRNHAVIMRKGYTRDDQADAVVVMANPGSCSPGDPAYQIPVVKSDFHKVPYVSVKDDPTQRQLMRLMLRMNWNVVSIINLSDICSGNMDDFIKKLKRVEQHKYEEHSIFSATRKKERESLYGCKKTRLILAWGKNPRIGYLACDALKKLSLDQPIFGLPFEKPKWGYRHPNPMIQKNCMQWLDDMEEQLRSEGALTDTIACTVEKEE